MATLTNKYVSITSFRCVLIVIDGVRRVLSRNAIAHLLFVGECKKVEVGAVNNWDSWTSSRFVLTWILTRTYGFFSFMLDVSHSFYMIQFEGKKIALSRLQAIGKLCSSLPKISSWCSLSFTKESFTKFYMKYTVLECIGGIFSQRNLLRRFRDVDWLMKLT